MASKTCSFIETSQKDLCTSVRTSIDFGMIKKTQRKKNVTSPKKQIGYEGLNINNFTEPTLEQGPHRPRISGGLSREHLHKRLEQARASNRLSLHAISERPSVLARHVFAPDADDDIEDGVEQSQDDFVSNASVSENFPRMSAAKSMRNVLDTRGFLDLD